MAWIGGYRLELTCDRKGGDYRVGSDGVRRDTLGHVHGEFPHVFTGESGTALRSEAKRAGWVLGHKGVAICPKCGGKVRRGRRIE
jgi:hypothetical protein